MSYYRRNLPHWQPSGGEYFITFMLNNSLPAHVIRQIKENRKLLRQDPDLEGSQLRKKIMRRIFKKYEHHLENEHYGNHWLKQSKIARMVGEAIAYRDKSKYDLYAYCIMSNHVHMVFRLLKNGSEDEYPVTKILQSLKRFTAGKGNELLDRSGQFWHHESYDRVIRDQDELESTIKYVLNNPVKAGLVDEWQDWLYSYCKPVFKRDLM